MAGTLLRIYRFDTLEPVGTLSVDAATGAIVSTAGNPEFQGWVSQNLGNGLHERRGHEYRSLGKRTVDVRFETILPSDPLFPRFLNLRLMEMSWCEESVRDAVMRHPNFANHPWRLAHPA